MWERILFGKLIKYYANTYRELPYFSNYTHSSNKEGAGNEYQSPNEAEKVFRGERTAAAPGYSMYFHSPFEAKKGC